MTSVSMGMGPRSCSILTPPTRPSALLCDCAGAPLFKLAPSNSAQRVASANHHARRIAELTWHSPIILSVDTACHVQPTNGVVRRIQHVAAGSLCSRQCIFQPCAPAMTMLSLSLSWPNLDHALPLLQMTDGNFDLLALKCNEALDSWTARDCRNRLKAAGFAFGGSDEAVIERAFIAHTIASIEPVSHMQVVMQHGLDGLILDL